jgi:pantoate--beta-alanine ligase
MKILRTIADLRLNLRALKSTSTIGLVPTMGAFHGGHIALFHAARHNCHAVVASLFVNPTQFSDPGDLAAYPRDEARDARIAEEAGVDMVFAPSVEELLPAGYGTWIMVDGPARGLEADFRPGHFRGVATICAKLFAIVAPQIAFFGQKDAQQVAVVRQMVRDLDFPVAIRVVPTVRDEDGLALSSRNVHLTGDDRQRALAIPRALSAGLTAYRSGADAVAAAHAALAGLIPDYVSVVTFDGQPTLVIAARVGAVRLIDNVRLTNDNCSEPPT